MKTASYMNWNGESRTKWLMTVKDDHLHAKFTLSCTGAALHCAGRCVTFMNCWQLMLHSSFLPSLSHTYIQPRSSKAEKNADGLQEIEREVDRYKDILQNLNKRIATNVSAGQPQDAVAREKRCKKVPEFQLGQLMEESVKDLPTGLLKDVLDTCGRLAAGRGPIGQVNDGAVG